ncbi:aspartic peptidase domain-containing protein [Favolaschia claudopus]|uniref:Aspartic peptidase domain-containing protein n=1 Tax=Favolaschia claudopus TaxID=2862362 RepID=A0AAW0CMG4_9AGAR
MTPRSLILLSLLVYVPNPQADPVHLPLYQQSSRAPSSPDFHSFAHQLFPRQSTDIPLTDLAIIKGFSQGYFIHLDIGTPPKTLPIGLGSAFADTFIAGTECTECFGPSPQGASVYDSSKSSTAVNKSTGPPTNITFANGLSIFQSWIFTDNLSLGPYSVLGTEFLQLRAVIGGSLDLEVSGLLGLAFQGISSTNTPPFWQAVSNQFPIHETSFWLTRAPTSDTPPQSPGGVITFGAITVQDQSLTVDRTTNQALIDIGTNLIIGPASEVEAIWALVPNSSKTFDDPTTVGSYQFPCSSSVNISFSFGGRTWPIDPRDINLGPVSTRSSQCLGSIILNASRALTEGQAETPRWIFGAPLLKNVYTVLQQIPPAVGFAELSTLAAEASSQSTVSQSMSATPSSPSVGSSGGMRNLSHKNSTGAIVGGVIGGLVLIVFMLAAFWLLRRRRRVISNVDDTPSPFITAARTTDSPVIMTRTDVPPLPASSPPSPPPALRNMKRAQTAAVHAHQLNNLSNEPASGPLIALGSPYPNPEPENHADTDVLRQLRNLQVELNRIAASHSPEAPPSYDHHD